ncbi:MAG: imidazolonepropionase [Deltaproteobacteria bacterium]|nr:imidazolonepropionase [Deltaproteobacteria bacterium]
MDHSLLLSGGRIATCAGPDDADPTGRLGVLDDGAILIRGGRIAWVGSRAEAPRDVDETVALEGRAVLPGLVDPHTHLLFGGSRVDEMARRRAGVDYQTIAAEGGGIASSMRATRAAGAEQLLTSGARRLRALRRHGVTTVEVKSGYGGDVASELRLLVLAQRLGALGITRVSPTLLGAHALPEAYVNRREDFVDSVVHEMIPAALGFASAVDVYCDEGAFTLEETRRILEAAKRAGFAIRAHVGQFADLGGCELLAELGALSADHLEQASDRGLAELGRAGVRAVLLPGAWRTLGQAPPEAERLRRAGVRMAVGTDSNPGTSPTTDLPLCAALAVRDAGLTLEEALLAITREAARAMGRPDAGRIEVGLPADLAVYDEEDPRVLAYALGDMLAESVWLGGERVVGPGASARVW